MDGEHVSGAVDRNDERKDPDAEVNCCPAVTHNLTEDDVEIDVRMFSALANETRYEVLRLLSAADNEICACELVPQLSVNRSTTSRALGVLHQVGLVRRRKDGRWRYYTTTGRAEKLLAAVETTRGEIA